MVMGGVVVEEGVVVVPDVVVGCGVEEDAVGAVNDVDAEGLGLGVVWLLNGVTVETDGVAEGGDEDEGGCVPD